ncbi:MAG: ABC transporter permease [Candidatus Caldatribacteriaceae bacterium]
MKVFLYLVSAHLKNTFRDRMALFWFFAFPVLFVFLFGIIFGGEEKPSSFKVALVEEARTPYGESLRRALEGNDAVRLFEEDLSSALEALQAEKRDFVVHVQEKKITVYHRPASAELAQAFLGHVKSVLFETELRQEGSALDITVEMQTVGISRFRQMDYFLPGVLAMALMQLGLFGTLDFVSLRERKIIRHLGATPLRREWLLWSEIAVRMAISLLQTGLIIVTGWFFFHVRVSGSLLSLLFWVLFGSATFVSLGYFIASFAKTIESAEGIIQMVQFPMMFLSGIFFPPEMMPESLRFLPRLLPLSYFGDALRNVMVSIPSQFGLGRDFMVLSGWLGVSSFLALRFFRWE